MGNWQTHGSIANFRLHWEKFGIDEKELEVRQNLRLSGVQSITKIYNDIGTFYITKISHGGRTIEYEWEAPSPDYMMKKGGIPYGCDDSYQEEGVENDAREDVLDAVFDEIITADLDPSVAAEKDEKYKKQTMRMSEKYIKTFEQDECEKNEQTITPVTPTPTPTRIEGQPISISEFWINPANIVWGKIKSFGDSQDSISETWIECSICKAESEHTIFNPPINNDRIYDYMVIPYRCDGYGDWDCGRANTSRIGKKTITTRKITIADPYVPDTTLEIVVPASIHAFDLIKDDIVKVKGEIERTDDKKVIKRLRCEQLEVLQRSHKVNVVQLTNVNDNVKSLENLQDDDNLDIGTKGRKAVFARYKEINTNKLTDDDFNKVIKQLVDENNEHIKALVMVNGKLNLSISTNSQLRKFRNSLLIPQHGDDGRLIKTGNNPFKLKWQQNENIRALATDKT